MNASRLPNVFPPHRLSRREMLHRAAGGFGAIALAGIWSELARANPVAAPDPLAPRMGHFPPRAKSVIFIFATGGVAHTDTFDYKPKLYADHGKTMAVTDFAGMGSRDLLYLKRPHWGFKQYGKSGAWVGDIFPHTGSVVDDLCIIRSVTGDSPGHDKATMGMHTGSFNFARPSIGSWVSYGLGTENKSLPSFFVITPAPPYAGAQTWGADFLPGSHQGTHVVPGPDPVANVTRRVPADELQQMELELLGKVNRRHLEKRSADAALEARIRSFETAFGMQREAPAAFDFSGETDETLALYGLQRGQNTGFGWQCLAARRLVERGVRFVELMDVGSSNNWDSHGDMDDHARLAKNTDQPTAALIKDLKRRGMLDETLVVWTTEFGRTPYIATATGKGREHHNPVFSSWLAGGGVRPGLVYGASDDIGAAVAEKKVHVHDLHATILHLLGLDHEKLTYRFQGRDFRLTDVAGDVVRGILA